MKSNTLCLLCISVFAILGEVSPFSTCKRSVIASKTSTSSPSSTIPSSTSLGIVIPSWVPYSVGHIVGGCSGTPIVISGTKKGGWYSRIPLPSFTPPNSIFAPIWTILYGLMGYCFAKVVKSTSPSAHLARKIWIAHYALNLSWAPIFFGLKRFRLGFIINLLLIASLGIILRLYHSIDPLLAYLQIPYMCWLIFATKLNKEICKLNPTVDGKNRGMIQAEMCNSGEGYNDVMLEYDIKQLQAKAASYTGL